MDRQTEFVERLSAQIVQWEAEIDRLRYKAENAPDAEKRVYLGKVEGLQQKCKEAQVTLQGIGTEHVDALDDLKKGTEEVLDDVKGDLRDAILKVK